MSVLSATIYFAIFGYLITSAININTPQSYIIIATIIIINIFSFFCNYKIKDIEISMENSIETISDKVNFIGLHKYNTRIFFNTAYWLLSFITFGASALIIISLLIILGIVKNIFSL